MGYRLAADLSYCVLNGDPYFLDIRRDRYFRLHGALKSAFLALSPDARIAEDAAEPLLRQGVVEWTNAAGLPAPAAIDTPMHSLAEQDCGRVRGAARCVSEIAWTLLRARHERRTTPLSEIIDRRRREIAPLKNERFDTEGARMASTFNQIRRVIPGAGVCLPDSIALLDFLARRGQPARIVIGIKGDPFAAHCWVQSDTLLLNETADVAAGFAPIGVFP